MSECVNCDSLTTSIVIVTLVTMLVLAVGAFLWARANFSPVIMKRWVSTVAIFFNHVQTVGVLGTLHLEWPKSLKAILDVLRLHLITIPQASCLLSPDVLLIVYNFMLIAFASLLLAPLVAKAVWTAFQGVDSNAIVFGAVPASFAILSLIGIGAVSVTIALQLCGSLLLCCLVISGSALGHKVTALDTFGDNAELLHSVIFAALLTMSWNVCSDVVFFYLPDPLHMRWHPEQLDENPIVLVSCVALISLEIVFAYRLGQNVLAFERGLGHGVWRTTHVQTCNMSGAFWGDTPRSIFPRRLERQVAFLISRFAAHASNWQLKIWRRQLVLFLIATASRVARDYFSGASEEALRFGFAGLAFIAILYFWQEHRAVQPFYYLFQNTIESWLFGANTVLLVLACVYSGLPVAGPARMFLEVLLALVLIGGLASGAAYAIRELRRTKQALSDIDLTAILATADSAIDGKLAERLGDGCIRLLSCSWLQSQAADSILARDASGAVIMRRRQDLPEDAFVPCDGAVALLQRGDRSVIALSHAWLTADHPDPHGTTLAAVRRYLASDACSTSAGLFWDFASMPQRGAKGRDRTREERATLSRGLGVMGACFASVTGTTVLQQRLIEIPDIRAAGVRLARDSDGLFNLLLKRAESGEVYIAALPPSDSGDGRALLRVGDVVASVDGLTPTEAGIDGLLAHIKAAGQSIWLKTRRWRPLVYNPSPYEGDGGRGWCMRCIFEQAVAMTVLAHVTAAKQQAEARGSQLLERFQKAEASRAKVYDIGGAAPVARECDLPPLKVLDDACLAIAKAAFTGSADGEAVPQMLAEFEWEVRNATFQALERDPSTTDVSMDVHSLLRAQSKGGTRGGGRSWLRPGLTAAARLLPARFREQAARSASWLAAKVVPAPRAHSAGDEVELEAHRLVIDRRRPSSLAV